MASLLEKVKHGWEMLEWRHAAARPGLCPICGATVFVRLNRTDWGVRCARCGGAPNTLTLVQSVRELVGDLGNRQVYCTISRWPALRILATHLPASHLLGLQ